ncbi:MAG: D-tyrosyl-tRNA(Tyr) deacylase, partial [Deltaproteobacteria bacterium]|nr:D-tyrosyl-tRNA(Tyr) deacylase [Deltaproteobacteria bacterium]
FLIQKGLLVLAGFENSDTPAAIEQMASKIINLRIFSDSSGKMNLSGQDVGAEYLLVSQFTLYANCRHGNRPSFEKAGAKEHAQKCYEHFVTVFRTIAHSNLVHHSPFGAFLSLELINVGPVTIWLDSSELQQSN